MNAAQFFSAVEKMPSGDVDALTGSRPFVVVAPHPDDETLGCAGLLAAARQRGIACRVVVVTDGGGSHPRSRSHPRRRLAALRQSESRAAAAKSGLSSDCLTFLGLRDRNVPLDGPIFRHAMASLAASAKAIAAASLFVTWRGDPHCDHEAVHDIAATAAAELGIRLWRYPIWGWSLRADRAVAEERPSGLRLDISRWQAKKRAAIACHRSQTSDLIDDDPGGFILQPKMLKRFLGPIEYFLERPP